MNILGMLLISHSRKKLCRWVADCLSGRKISNVTAVITVWGRNNLVQLLLPTLQNTRTSRV
ncbi:unnamed protein product [Acanthoscelides obtectus]|uniref:Uncharacterized protein n=1 Tax=Acanthoscelides obtectus TaxID=200917 RepID=A0A9P0MJR4_ACAOB|nr:unnamed protein product [Acanthoscelides obtectus]CAK1667763.1 hypothetical protein AOBTE_LOCUS26026 [Acanthoscelides obtectus]